MISILFLFLNLMMVTGMGFLLKVAQGLHESVRLQQLTDEILLSSLRIRAQGLEKIAERWSAVEPLLQENTNQGVRVSCSQVPAILSKLQEVKNALPGYKGRIKSVAQVVLQTYPAVKEGELIWDPLLSDLGLQVEGRALIDENNQTYWAPSFLIKRSWDLSNRLAAEAGQGELKVKSLIKMGPLQATSKGKIDWDVDSSDLTLQATGNGGFPRTFDDTLDRNRVRPFRFPVYYSRLRST